MVAAANRGPDFGTITKPADDPWVITVGALDTQSTIDRSDDTVADFSSRGPTADDRDKPDLVAPGMSLVGLRAPGSYVDESFPEARILDDYFRGSGTSFAAAVTSGTAALLRQAHPDWTPDQIKGALLAATAPGPVEAPWVDGHGSLDVAAAAALTDPAPANQDLVRSDGTGSIAAARGSLEVEMRASDGTSKVLDKGVHQTAQDSGFDADGYRGGTWDAASWSESQWYGNHWWGNHWWGNHWWGNHWWGNHWW